MKKQLSSVMLKAWEIARDAANRFGNRVSEYIGESLKIAWAIVRSERGSIRLSLQARSRNNKNRTSWVKKIYSDDGVKVQTEFVDHLSDFDAEYREYRLEDGFYIICDLGEQKYVQIVDSEIKEIDYVTVKKELAYNLVYVEISEGSRNHKSYIAEIVGEHERWGMNREFISRNSDRYRIKYAYLEEGKVYEIQDAGERNYVVIEDGKQVEIEKENVLSVVQEKMEEKENAQIEKVLPLIKELQELILKIQNKSIPLEEGIQASKERLKKHSLEKEIELLKMAIERGKNALK